MLRKAYIAHTTGLFPRNVTNMYSVVCLIQTLFIMLSPLYLRWLIYYNCKFTSKITPSNNIRNMFIGMLYFFIVCL